MAEPAARSRVVSISGCESAGQWACEPSLHGFDGRLVAQDEAGSAVELMRDPLQVLFGVNGQVCALGKVLTEQSVCVFVRAALPW